MRIPALCLALTLAAAPAVAQQEASGRYAFAPAEGGALRLDTLTGAVAFCAGGSEARACTPVTEADPPASGPAGLDERIASLEARIAALEAAQASGTMLLPDEETVDRVMTLTDRLMRRFFGMVRDMKKDMEGETL